MVSADVPAPPDVRVMLVEERVTAGPDGDTVAVSVTVPAKPLTLVALIVEVPEEP
jgi:hypothetical protein